MSKIKLAHNLSRLAGPRVGELEVGELFVRHGSMGSSCQTVYIAIDNNKFAYPKCRYFYAVSLKSGRVTDLSHSEKVVRVNGELSVELE